MKCEQRHKQRINRSGSGLTILLLLLVAWFGLFQAGTAGEVVPEALAASPSETEPQDENADDGGWSPFDLRGMTNRRIAEILSNRLSSPPHFVVEIRDVSGLLSSEVSVGRMTISDARGTWLIGQALRLRWSPTSLFRGRVLIHELIAGTVHMERLPEGAPEEPEEPTGPPSLPTGLPEVTVEQLVVHQLNVAEPVLGQSAVFRLDGKILPPDPPPGLTASLHIQRTDAPLPKAALTVSIRENPSTLTLNAEIEDAAEGLISSVLGVGDAGPLFLRVQGEGPLSAWEGQLSASAGRYGQLDTQVGLRLEVDSTRLSADGRITPTPALIPPELSPVVGEQSRFQLEVRTSRPHVFVVDRLDIQTEGPALQLTGVYDLEQQTQESDFVLKIADLSLLEQAAGVRLSGQAALEGVVSGPFQHPSGTAFLSLNQPRVEEFQAERLNFDVRFEPLDPQEPSFQGVDLVGNGSVEGLIRLDGQPLPENCFNWSIAARAPVGEEISVTHFQIKGEQTTFTLSGRVGPQGPVGKVVSNLEIRDLRLFSPFLGIEGLSGSLTASADLNRDVQRDFISGLITARALDLGGLPPPGTELLGPEVNANGTFALTEGTQLHIPGFQISGVASDLSGEANVDLATNRIQGTWQASLPRLEVLSETLERELGGSVQLNGKVSGTPSLIEVSADARGRRIIVEGTRFDTVALNLIARDLPETPRGHLELSLSQEKQTLALNTDFLFQNRILTFSDTELKTLDTRITGNMALNLDTRLAEGRLRAKSGDLSRIGRFIGQDLGGRLTLDAQLRPVEGRQNVRLDLDGGNVSSDFGRAERVRINADLRDVMNAPQGTADVRLTGLQSGDLTLGSLNLTAKGDAERVTFDGRGAGQIVERFDLQTRGALTLSPEAQAVRLEQLQGRFGEYEIALFQPVRLHRSDDRYAVEGLALGLGRGRIDASGSLQPGRVDVSADFTNLPLDLARYAGVYDVAGSAGGSLRMTGPPENPEATAQLRLADVRLPGPALENVPPITVSADARLQQNRLNAALTVQGPTEKPVQADLSLPVEFSLDPFAFSLPPEGSVEGRIAAEADIARLVTFFPLDEHRLAGRLTLDLNIGGTTADPRFTGPILIENGAYENLSTGTVLRRIGATMAAQDTVINVERFSATDAGNGTVSGEGRVDLDMENRFPFEMRVRFRNAQLIRRDDITAATDGRLRFSGSMNEANLEGKLTIAPAELRFPEETPPDIPQLDVIEINLPEGKRSFAELDEARSGEAAEMRIFMDIDLVLPNRVFMRGRGLDSEWQGRLRVTGRVDNPIVTGRVSLVRGSFDFLDRRFALVEESFIEFYGNQPPSPDLDISAESRARDVTARLRITGDASEPEIALESDPPLPEDEILSRLLFGRTLERITPMQAVRLGLALRTLAGGDNALDVLGRMRRALRVEQLEVREGEGEGNGTLLGIGRYLGDDIYLEVEKGIGIEGDRASVEVEIIPNITLDSEVGTDSQAEIGVNWKYDY